mmetsp:Transcript_50955/g.119454  ORF Transcript_50955/g.119454 Transcript_50955/m.119454 type:complete len:237 (-) Transcript_50955:608-1318(-)
MQPLDQRAIHPPPVRDHGHHAQRFGRLGPALPQTVQQQRAGQARFGIPGGRQGLGFEAAQERRQRAGPQPCRRVGHGSAGARLLARAGLDLDIEHAGIGLAEAGDLGEPWQGFGREGRAVPATGVERGEIGPVDACGRPAAAGGALQRVVMQQKGFAVPAQLDITFEGSKAETRAHAEGGQRVLGGELASAAMRQPQRVGPGLHPADSEGKTPALRSSAAPPCHHECPASPDAGRR